MDTLQHQLTKFEAEHHQLDIAIEKMADDPKHDQLALQRLKRRKLHLKDEIIALRGRLIPDILA